MTAAGVWAGGASDGIPAPVPVPAAVLVDGLGFGAGFACEAPDGRWPAERLGVDDAEEATGAVVPPVVVAAELCGVVCVARAAGR